MDFAKNWLAQHIKNTDFKYRYKLATRHKTPEPYIWNNEFEVFYKRLDEEHQGLFKIMFSERFAKMSAPVKKEEIKWAQDWLAQHIKNTDFGYKGHLKHEVPEPYVWDQSFATDYTRLDDEHDILFAQILAVSQHPEDASKLDELKKGMWNHFQYEEQRYCSVPGYSCVDHKMKHYKFWVILGDLQAPINCEQINWAKNWLAQHIKNTDHGYKKRLNGPDSGESMSGALP